jgi:hypothetical protein
VESLRKDSVLSEMESTEKKPLERNGRRWQKLEQDLKSPTETAWLAVVNMIMNLP